MSYKILFYSPDRHLLYDASTPDQEGVGGGLTARIRLAQALSKLGHRVTMISNVTHAHRNRGVDFLPLSEAEKRREVDVLVMTSTGGELSLEPVEDLPVKADLREVWVMGASPIKQLAKAEADFIVAVSNAIRDVIHREWGIPYSETFVCHNGLFPVPVRKGLFSPGIQRDPYSMVYTSHPSKGLDAAISILRILRKKEPRFKLHIYGGNALWGGEDRPPEPEEGVIYHGMVGQKELANALRQASFSIHLQEILEGFSLALVETMGYGCIPIVSPVGGNREAVQDGYNGFWIEGDHRAKENHQKAAEIISTLVQDPAFSAYIRRNAKNVPWTWENQAKVWLQHWQWALEGIGRTLSTPTLSCQTCGGEWLVTADGYHCLGCGRYSLNGR